MNLAQIPGNDTCADCRQQSPRHGVYNLGILICESCAHIHRALGSHISKVRSLSLEQWDDASLKVMTSKGNTKVNAEYEAHVPAYYKRPTPDDPHILREQWIRAKYERKEFLEPKPLPYTCNIKEGYLWKKGKDDKAFQKRRFVLDTTENTLKYFNKDEARDPKATLRLDGINLIIVPEKVGHHNAMQITFEQNGQTRHIYVYADDGQDLLEWYTSIRAAKLKRLQIAYPNENINLLARRIMWEYLKEGWLSKTGPRSNDAFRKRWVTVDYTKLTYSEEALCPFPKGEIFIRNDGVTVEEGFLNNLISNGRDASLAFVLNTPGRSFQFMADSVEETNQWITAIRQAISNEN